MSPITKFAIVCVSSFGILQSSGHLQAQERHKSQVADSSTQDGITVQLEKVTVERILNTPAWLKAKEQGSKHGIQIVKGLREHLPARLVTFSVSVVGETKRLGISRIGFVDGKRTVSSSNRFFSPPKWQPRLPKLVVDPKANGIETQALLSGDTKISDIFPTDVEVQVTAANGKKLTFRFNSVQF